MKPLLVALIAHLAAGADTSPDMPTYAVLSLNANGSYTATATNHLQQPEQFKWQLLRQTVTPTKDIIPLCYTTTYKGLQSNFTTLRKSGPEVEGYFLKAGGNHFLAMAAVRWCNASLHKMKFFNAKDPAFLEAEKQVRETAYIDDATYLKTCKGTHCAEAPAALARGTIGIPFEAKR